MKDLLKFEVRNKNKLLKYFLFGVISALTLTGITFGIDYFMNIASNALLGKLKNEFLLISVIVITTILLALQMNKTDEFEPSSTVGAADRKERGILLYLSRITIVFVIALYILCLCN